MGRPLRGRGKLNQTAGGCGWRRKPTALLRREVFHTDELLKVFRRNFFVQAGYGLDVEAHLVLFLGLFQCTAFWSPSD